MSHPCNPPSNRGFLYSILGCFLQLHEGNIVWRLLSCLHSPVFSSCCFLFISICTPAASSFSEGLYVLFGFGLMLCMSVCPFDLLILSTLRTGPLSVTSPFVWRQYRFRPQNHYFCWFPISCAAHNYWRILHSWSSVWAACMFHSKRLISICPCTEYPPNLDLLVYLCSSEPEITNTKWSRKRKIYFNSTASPGVLTTNTHICQTQWFYRAVLLVVNAEWVGKISSERAQAPYLPQY